jgi:flagellar M-ring protein FliF
MRQKILLAATVLGVLGGLFALVRWQQERDFVTLHSSLNEEDAAAVVAKLKESGIEYRLTADGTGVRIRSARLAETRLLLASAGVPKKGRLGFELLDRTNFGLSEAGEKANYQRALEGELERTVMTIAEVEHARVHIAPPKDSVFLDQRRPAKASVLLRLRPGAQLAAHNIKAVTHLVASAVEGLSPDMVSVLDVHGNLLTRPKLAETGSDAALNDLLLEYKAKIERDLLAKINNTLEPLLGAERFRAAVSVDCDLATTDQSEETFDPSQSVMTTSQRSEDLAGVPQPSGVPGTASNLPRPTSRPGAGAQGVARRTENITYQSSRLVKRTHLPQGNVRRISVSVLLDHMVRFEGSGPQARRVVEPPSPERLKATRDLVAGVVGFQSERGDQLIVEALPFESTLSYEPPPAPPSTPAGGGPPARSFPLLDLLQKPNRTTILIGAGVALVLLLAVLFLLFRVRSARRRSKRVANQPELEAGGSNDLEALSAAPNEADSDKVLQAELAKQQRLKALQEKEILAELASSARLPSNSTKKTEVLTKYFSEEIRSKPEGVVQLVRTWISDSEA